MMNPQVLLVVGVDRQPGPADQWEEQANASGSQAKQNPRPHRDRHSQKHPEQSGGGVAFVNLSETRHHDTEESCAFIFRIHDFFVRTYKRSIVHLNYLLTKDSAPGGVALTIAWQMPGGFCSRRDAARFAANSYG